MSETRSSDGAWRFHEVEFASDALNPELAISPWAGHRRFAYDLVRRFAPQAIVELGTHWGCSFFAFCQAALDGKSPTEVFAIDTWEGDEHAGHYGEEVFALVAKTLADRFASIRFHLVRKKFDDAARDFGDGTIDLLHIDGFHTYEATRHDFETWLPRLRDDAIVLFHDVASDCGYGSARYWSELRQSHPGFTFEHSWGLGILFPKGETRYRALLKDGFADKMPIYRWRADFELSRERARRDLQWQREQTDLQWKRAEETTALVEKLRWELSQANARAGDLERRLTSLEGSIAVRVSRRFDRFPRLKGAVISVANRLLP